jgi:hypothetical protein
MPRLVFSAGCMLRVGQEKDQPNIPGRLLERQTERSNGVFGVSARLQGAACGVDQLRNGLERCGHAT